LFSKAGSAFHPTPTVSDRLQFTVYAFQICSVGGSIYPGAALDYVPGEWVCESCVVSVAHLLDLQIYAGSFEISQWEEMACGFFQGRHLLGICSAWQGIHRLSMS
jgi:hypothetical protein